MQKLISGLKSLKEGNRIQYKLVEDDGRPSQKLFVTLMRN